MSVEFENDSADDQDDLKPETFRNEAVLFSSDWTTETILNQLLKGNIDINPEFQRRDAWDTIKKSRFIESIILGLPIPQLVLSEKTGQRGNYIVLDGKQRLTTLLKFLGKGVGRDNGFKLTGLQILKPLNGQSYENLLNDIQHADNLNQFQNHTIRSVVIRNAPDVDFLNLVFIRLNTGSVQLSPQELRQALFPGPFVRFAEEFTNSSAPIKKLLNNSEPDFRMRDIELFVRFMGMNLFLDNYQGDMKKFLDYTCDTLNKKWIDHEAEIKEISVEFDNAIAHGYQIFDKYFSRQMKGDKYEKSLNRAVLDSMLMYFSDKDIRELSLAKKAAIVAKFKELCSYNRDFQDAISLSTKSMKSTFNRLNIWGRVLKDILNMDIALPMYLEDINRIRYRSLLQK